MAHFYDLRVFLSLPSTTITRKPLVRLKVEESLWLQFHLFSLIFSHVSASFPPNTEALIIISLESFGFSPSHRIWAAKSPLILFNIHNAPEQYLENQNPAYLLWCLQHQHFLQTNVLNFKPHLTRQTSKERIYLSEFLNSSLSNIFWWIPKTKVPSTWWQVLISRIVQVVSKTPNVSQVRSYQSYSWNTQNINRLIPYSRPHVGGSLSSVTKNWPDCVSLVRGFTKSSRQMTCSY